MSTTTTTTTTATTTTIIGKPNIGVFTNPDHKLWVGESQPTVETVKEGKELKEGEVTIGIRSTGICGYRSLTSLKSVPRHSIGPDFDSQYFFDHLQVT